MGDTSALSAGDFGVLVAVYEKRENVVAVPKSALQKGVSGMYVYRIENGEKVMTDVVTGMSDGVYTEILSGVSVGDEIFAVGKCNFAWKGHGAGFVWKYFRFF